MAIPLDSFGLAPLKSEGEPIQYDGYVRSGPVEAEPEAPITTVAEARAFLADEVQYMTGDHWYEVDGDTAIRLAQAINVLLAATG